MNTICATQARTRFSDLLDRVARGESFRITHNGRPVARLVPDPDRDPTRIERAVLRLKRFHQDMPEVPLQEILDPRHQGHLF